MSTLTINAITGTGSYAVPTTDAELATANLGINSIIGGVANVSFNRCLCFVATQSGVSPSRLLSARLDGFMYNSLEILDASTVQTAMAAIQAALVADPNIAAIGPIDVDLREEQREWIWQNDATHGVACIGGTTRFTRAILDAGLGGAATIFSGAMPGSWTTKTTRVSAIVWLSFVSSSNPASLGVRALGDTSDPTASGKVSAQYTHSLFSGEASAVVCKTDGSGQFEIKGTGTGTIALQNAAFF